MPDLLPEPWLRGHIAGVHPLQAAVLRSFEMAWEDLEESTGGLTSELLWTRPGGAAAVGFHLRHIPGSIDRLLTYAEGRQLTAEQMAFLKSEAEPGLTAEQLLHSLKRALDDSAARVRSFDPAQFAEERGVGRKLLPTTLAGLLVHIAEHTQRHVGQAVTTARIVKALQ